MTFQINASNLNISIQNNVINRNEMIKGTEHMLIQIKEVDHFSIICMVFCSTLKYNFIEKSTILSSIMNKKSQNNI